MRLRPELRLGPLAGFGGGVGKGGVGKEEKGRGGKGREEEGRGGKSKGGEVSPRTKILV